MLTIGNIGDYLEEGESVDTREVDVRMAQGKRRVDEGKLQRIIQAVTMAVLIGLGEAHEVNGEGNDEDEQRPGPSMCMIAIAGMLLMCICRTLFTAAVLLKSRVGRKAGKKRRERKEEEKERTGKRRKKTVLHFADSGEMTEEEYIAELKRQIREESRSIESTTILEEWLGKLLWKNTRTQGRFLKSSESSINAGRTLKRLKGRRKSQVKQQATLLQVAAATTTEMKTMEEKGQKPKVP